MKRVHGVAAFVLVLTLASCASPGAPDSATLAALAPTGTMRVGFISSGIYAVKDAATGEVKVVAADIGRDMARRLGVPFAGRAGESAGRTCGGQGG